MRYDCNLSGLSGRDARWRQPGVVVAALAAVLAGFMPLTASAQDVREIINKLCVGCHGFDGKGAGAIIPHLGGLQTAYLKKQLDDFASGARKSEIMKPFVEKLRASDRQALAAYYGGLPPVPGVVKDPVTAELGRIVYEEGDKNAGLPACAGCHKPDGTGTLNSVRLAGQEQMYTVQQLQYFKAGIRSNDRARLMRTVASRMTDEEMRVVAEYIAGLAPVPSQP